jgi:DNA-directed RNA polymerase specialized sigma24 family protein
MGDPSGIKWNEIKWVDISRKLAKRTAFVAQKAAEVFNCGISFEDVLQDTYTAFFESELEWDPKKASLEAYLWGVAKNKLKDHIKRGHKVGGSLDDPDFLETPTDSSHARFVELLAQLLADAEGDEEVEVIRASQQINNSGNIITVRLTRRSSRVSDVESMEWKQFSLAAI